MEKYDSVPEYFAARYENLVPCLDNPIDFWIRVENNTVIRRVLLLLITRKVNPDDQMWQASVAILIGRHNGWIKDPEVVS